MKLFKRAVSIVLALTLCLCSGLVAFAAEEVPVEDEVVVSEGTGIMPMAIGALLYNKSAYFNTGIQFTITTTSANVDADFSVAVFGNSSARYSVTMTAANGSIKTATVYGNGTPAYFNMAYAQAGDYVFDFCILSGTASNVYGEAKIYD